MVSTAKTFLILPSFIYPPCLSLVSSNYNRDMGNCQAVDAAALVVQHPDGRIERMYWSVCVSDVMKMNPGHYVSLIIPLPVEGEENLKEKEKTVQFTRVKLLRPSDRLVLGKAYRLVTSQGWSLFSFFENANATSSSMTMCNVMLLNVFL